jgi:hypothetical protein
VPHAYHEGDDPPAQRNFHADIQQQEKRTEPGNPSRAFREQRLAQATAAGAGATCRMLRVPPEGRPGIVPEAVDRGRELDDRAANLLLSAHPRLHPRG